MFTCFSILQLSQLLEMRDTDRDYTPIFDAVIANAPENVQLLVEHGAVVDAVARGDSLTPAHLAAEKGYSECLKHLLKGGNSQLYMYWVWGRVRGHLGSSQL